MDNSIIPISSGYERAEAHSTQNDYNIHGPYILPIVTDIAASNTFSQIQPLAVVYTDTYYIYSFDGKLLAEYDQTGNCVRDYIYAGNRMIAEFRPLTGKYYYYMSDQISSTRIITDDVGTVVYSEAYGPYGDVQKTWTKTYDPKQKFSGKERGIYSELDYFGARYFDNNSYRFISVDPVITKDKAMTNPQYWNLYAYDEKGDRLIFTPPVLVRVFPDILYLMDRNNLLLHPQMHY